MIETDFDISIGEEGFISGLIKADNIVVSGSLEGKLACQSIEILKTGKVMGEVVTGEMMIESGGKFIGESRELTEGGMIVSFPEEEKKSLQMKSEQKIAQAETIKENIEAEAS